MKSDGEHISVFASIVDDVLGDERGGWETHDGSHWYELTPSHSPRRLQGWKIHLSAEPGSAEEVLRRAASILVVERCAFKFTRDPSALRRSLGRGFDRAGSGKFLTVYPADDDRFRVLAKELHEATARLSGPRILSDRPYAPGSLVHYRYGGFSPVSEVGEDGMRRDMLVRPDGTMEPDLRVPWFRRPDWAQDPLESTGEPRAARESPPSVLLNDRYRVTGAIRHTNRGGVYRALDTAAGDARVIIKQARPYTDMQSDGRDAREMLLNEAAVLTGLQDMGLCARFVEAFTIHDEQFVVQSEVDGQTLENWVLDRTAQGDELPLDVSLACVDALLELLGRVHAAGFVLQDFSPGNVLRRADGSLTLIDLETATRVGELGGDLMTPGFSAPERRSARHRGASRTAEFADDLYSLGAVICFLAVEQPPLLVPDRGAATRPDSRRLRGWLDAAAAAGRPLARRVRAVVEGLTQEEPGERWGIDRARSVLLSGAQVADVAADAPGPESLLLGTLRHLLASAGAHGREMWRPDPRIDGIVPGTVMHGTSGVVSVLLRAWSHRAFLPNADRERLERALERADRWFDAMLTAPGPAHAGLLGGHAGALWVAHDLARVVGDRTNQERALAMAARLPLDGKVPDLYHGAAGTGMALIHLWRVTGDERMRAGALACADALLRQAVTVGSAPAWPTTSSGGHTPGSGGAERMYQGYAHGSAGIGAFLLEVASEWDDPACHGAAMAVGASLVDSAHLVETGAGQAAWWDMEAERPGERQSGWCQGSAGIGSFLLRLGEATGENGFRVLARQAAAAVGRTLPHLGPGLCHGFAGSGHFLLDMVAADPGDARIKEAAQSALPWLAVRGTVTDGDEYVLAGEATQDGRGQVLGVGFGVAGDLDFLLRSVQGGSGPWRP